MKTVYLNDIHFFIEWPQPALVALGFFDGIHLGHQRLIMKGKEIAKRNGLEFAVMTFYPHPKEVIKGEKVNYLMPPKPRRKR